MKITAPQMGTIKYMLDDLVRRLDGEFVLPPATTSKTIEIGMRYSPEFACLPLKITVGNFIEALEAGTDMLVMAGGCGPCRFGYYAEIHKIILENIGKPFEMTVVEPPLAHPVKFVKAFKKMAPGKSIKEIYRAILMSFKKAQAFDMLEKKLLQTRCYESVKGSSDKAYQTGVKLLKSAFTEEEISDALNESLAEIDGIDKDLSRDVLKVGIAGEFYMLLEPIVNFDIERWFGQRNIYVERSVYTTDWIGPDNNKVSGIKNDDVREAAGQYLSHTVGGEGQLTIGHVIHYAEEGFDGVIHLFPFTCMPETIAKSILPKVSKDFDIPVLSLVFDEHTGKAGVITRLEALVDLMWSRRERKEEERLCKVI